MILTSESVAKIAPALLKVQQQVEAVQKSASNPFFKSKYADLNSVMEAVKGPLHDNGICVLQFPGEPAGSASSVAGSTLALTTRLQHSSGEYIESTAIVPLAKQDPQGFGSAVTYARRYSLQSALGLMAVDDDAESAVVHETRQTKSNGTPKKASIFGNR